jgi:hypothetical protein
MNICSDNNCNSNCISWIATNNKCEPCKNNEPCSDNNPSSITTYNSFKIYSDPSCNIQVPNTYSIPIILDNNCNQLYLYGNESPRGSYKAYNLSMIIGIISGIILVFIIVLYCTICRYYKCCKKSPPSFEYQNAIAISHEQSLPPIQYYVPEYGYQIQPQQPVYIIYNNQPTPTLPSAPPAPIYYPPPHPLQSVPNQINII